MDLDLLNFKYLGGLVRIETHYNPGSWDNYAMDPNLYYAIVINDLKQVESIRVTMELGEKLKTIKPSIEAVALYNKIEGEKVQKKLAEDKARIEKAEKELKEKKSLLQSKVEVLRGKNKGFKGIARWLGETQYGEALMLVDETGKKVYTKPTNVKKVA